MYKFIQAKRWAKNIGLKHQPVRACKLKGRDWSESIYLLFYFFKIKVEFIIQRCECCLHEAYNFPYLSEVSFIYILKNIISILFTYSTVSACDSLLSSLDTFKCIRNLDSVILNRKKFLLGAFLIGFNLISASFAYLFPPNLH